jgi:hypothetical protein
MEPGRLQGWLTYLGRPLKVEACCCTKLKKDWWGAGYKLTETTNP